MRQVVFAVVLIGASFLGGAFVNGPGLKWLQAKVLGHVGMTEDVPSISLPGSTPTSTASATSAPANSPSSSANASDSLKSNPGSQKVASRDSGKRAGSGKSSRPNDGAPVPEPDPAAESTAKGTKPSLGNMLGALLGPADASAKEAGKGNDAKASTQKQNPKPLDSKTPSTLAAGSAGKSETKDQGTEASLPLPPLPEDSTKSVAMLGVGTGTPSPETTSAKSGGLGAGPAPLPDATSDARAYSKPAPLDPSVTPAILASLSSDTATSPKVPARQVSAGSEPRPLPIQTPISNPGSQLGGGDGAGTSRADDWGTIRRKLRDLGVSRYTIEGEPGGRVLFSCLIPLAGRQAVTQRFEAEGDDELGAARAVLRRIALWRATETNRSAGSR